MSAEPLPQKPKPIATKVSECIALGRIIEEEQQARAAQRKSQMCSLSRRLRSLPGPEHVPERLRVEAELRSLRQGTAREAAALAVGMDETSYQRAREVVRAAQQDPERFGDLIAILDSRPIAEAWNELRRRTGRVYKRPSTREHIPQSGAHPESTALMNRACSALQGAVMGFQLVDVSTLSDENKPQWLTALTDARYFLGQLHKEILKTYEER